MGPFTLDVETKTTRVSSSSGGAMSERITVGRIGKSARTLRGRQALVLAATAATLGGAGTAWAVVPPATPYLTEWTRDPLTGAGDYVDSANWTIVQGPSTGTNVTPSNAGNEFLSLGLSNDNGTPGDPTD